MIGLELRIDIGMPLRFFRVAIWHVDEAISESRCLGAMRAREGRDWLALE
jgi:hypothetical protein